MGLMVVIMIFSTAIMISRITTTPESDRLRIAREEATINRIFFSLVFRQNLYIAGSSVILLSVLMGTYGLTRGHINRSRVHHAIIDKADIPIDKADLPRMAPILTGLVSAVQMTALNAGREEGKQEIFEMYRQVSGLQKLYLDTMKGTLPHDSLPAIEQKAIAHVTPSFASLIQSGAIAPGKSLIIGYTGNGKAIRSELSENYSTVVIGQSGTGKTTGEAFAIAQTILAYNASYSILDPHYPDKRKESLGDRLGVLIHLPQVQIYSKPLLLDEIVLELDHGFEQHKESGIEKPAHIIVVDEHSLWKNSSNGGKDLLRFEEKIVYEGRKFGWYLHVTSKSPLAQDFGSSAIRDNFVTSLLYKTKKHQAQTFYKDSRQVEMVQSCKKPGQCVFTDSRDTSQVITVPFCTSQDMYSVAQKVGNGSPIIVESTPVSAPVTVSHTHTPGHTIDTGEVTLTDAELLQRMKEKKDAGISISQMSKDLKFGRTYLSKWMSGSENMTDVLRSKLQEYCQKKGKVIPFKLDND